MDVILQTENLSKRYGSFYALWDCTLTVRKGQIYGLVGRNGAGKTTLMRLICGQSPSTGGRVSLFGSADEASLVENRKRIGCMIEAPAFYPDLSAKKNLKLYCIKKVFRIPGRLMRCCTLWVLQTQAESRFRSSRWE